MSRKWFIFLVLCVIVAIVAYRVAGWKFDWNRSGGRCSRDMAAGWDLAASDSAPIEDRRDYLGLPVVIDGPAIL